MRVSKFLPVIFLLLGALRGSAGAASLNEYVKIEVRAASTEMRPGESGAIEIRFYPADGIHVNADPPVAFSLDSATALILHGKPAMATDTRTGYLSTAAPVTQQISIGSDVGPGPLTVKGTVTYFFCSDAEGWCNRQKQPVEFTILVKP